ncbi:MAG: hypothetical protein OK454_09970 [Thaumarchaeota archaeon]|nr:hypothetical protein [Nitrososphaerota archaeon]MDA4137395.1 hypothetical protein [Nitrososphaerota archaeon]
MTAQELGLPPRFEEAMKRRLGATGIFVEVGGKYYLDEARLQQVEQQRGAGDVRGGQWASRKNMFALRMVRRVVGVSAIILVVLNIFVFGSLDVRLVVVALVVAWIALTVFQLYYIARLRGRPATQGLSGGVSAGIATPAVTTCVASRKPFSQRIACSRLGLVYLSRGRRDF